MMSPEAAADLVVSYYHQVTHGGFNSHVPRVHRR